MGIRIRCHECGKFATTTAEQCKTCGSDHHLRHCHCDENHETCTHEWWAEDWHHRHTYTDGDHRHGE